MRYLAIGLVAAVLATAAGAQDSGWGYFQGEGGAGGAGVQSADGGQLLIKCDKPGKHQVFAVIVAQQNLAPPLPPTKFESQPVRIRFDTNAPAEDNWRANDKFVMAVDQGNTRTLTRLLQKMAVAKTMQFEVRPLRLSPYSTSFNVSGAKAAIDKVYADCKDDNPLG